MYPDPFVLCNFCTPETSASLAGVVLNNRSLSSQETAVDEGCEGCTQGKWSVLCETEVLREEHGLASLLLAVCPLHHILCSLLFYFLLFANMK